LARFSQFDLSSDKSKLDSAKPRVSISIDIQEEKNANNLQEKDCSTRKNYCKHNQDWQTTVQQPLYVEEPRWIDIDVDYTDSSRVDNSDPYILTRGKKIYGINDPGKTIEDHEAILDYLSKNKKLSIKNRVRRSAKTNEGSWDKTADEKNRIKNRSHYDSLQDKDTNNTAIIEVENKKSFKIDNRQTITDFVEQRQKIQREDIPNDNENGSNKTAKIGQIERLDNSKNHFAININKDSVLLKNQKLPESRKKREIYDANSKIDVEKNKIKTYERMKNKVYINKLNNLGASDLFTLSQDKDLINSGIESLKDTDRNKFIERTWKLHYAHRKKLESEREGESEEDKSEINKDNTGITDSQLTNSINSETKVSNHREKRNVCKTCKIKSQLQQDEWLKDIEKKIQESLSLERRDKHSDILERLSLREPYIISRGKKAPQDFGKDDLSPVSNSRYDEDRAKVMSLPESLLRTLLMKTSICNNDDCDINVNRLSPRDRRGTLDEIFAAYDPYYVARGKRMNGSQKGVLFETDARQ